MLFDSGFLQNWQAELKKMNKGKEGPIIAIEFLDIAARHRTCISTSIPSIRRLSENDVNTYKETKRNSTRLHNNLVESRKDKDKPGSKINLEKDNIVIAVDSTGIKVTNRGEWILDKWKNKKRMKRIHQNTRSSKYKDKENSVNDCNKRRCL